MSLIVDKEYYDTVVELYKTEIGKIEQCIEDYKNMCESIYSVNNFGTCLQEVLQEIYVNFYMMTSGKLEELLEQVEITEVQFTEDVEENDKL